MPEILVVDDEPGIRELMREILEEEGYEVRAAENGTAARAALDAKVPDLVLLDIWMPDTDGVSLLKEWASTGLLTMPVIMMSGHATIDTAVEATRIGATAFLEKPITLAKLLKAVDLGLNKPLPKVGAGLPVRNSLAPAVELTVEAAMTGGTLPEPVMDIGPQSSQSFNLEGPLRTARDEFEKAYFEYHLAKESGSMTRVAEKTGLERTHLYRKLKQLGVDLARGKRNGF